MSNNVLLSTVRNLQLVCCYISVCRDNLYCVIWC